MEHALVEDRLVADVAGFVDDPLGYVRYAFPGSPDEQQTEQLQRVGAALRVGYPVYQRVTPTVAARLCLWAMSTRPHLAGIVTASTEQRLRVGMWRRIAEQHQLARNGHWFTRTAAELLFRRSGEFAWALHAIPASGPHERFAGFCGADFLAVVDTDAAHPVPGPVREVLSGAMACKRGMWLEIRGAN